MESLALTEIIEAIGGVLLHGKPEGYATGISTDTRTLKPGDLFFALKGEHTDGHAYLAKAVESGAVGLVVSRKQDPSDIPGCANRPVIKVNDTLWALGDLAGHYRSKFDVKVIAVTGSVGKTTTKEMISSILSRRWKTLKNEANFNNEIGVPLTIFKLDRTHDALVLELAMRGLGEIKRLAQISKPHVAVITNIGLSHIERLGSQGAIAEAKSEVLSELPPDGIAVLNAEDGYYELLRHKFSGKVVSFGSCKSADVSGVNVDPVEDGRCECIIRTRDDEVRVSIPMIGHYNLYNALAAAATGVALGFDLQTIRDGLESFTPPAMRMELVGSNAGYVILNDTYNASPASMTAALKTLQALAGHKRKIAVLGDMLELGDYAQKAHRDIGAALRNAGVDILVAVGELARGFAEGARKNGLPETAIQWYPDSIQAAKHLKNQVMEGDAILVKGSRAMKMEEIVRILLSD